MRLLKISDKWWVDAHQIASLYINNDNKICVFFKNGEKLTGPIIDNLAMVVVLKAWEEALGLPGDAPYR